MAGPGVRTCRFVRGWFKGASLHDAWGQDPDDPDSRPGAADLDIDLAEQRDSAWPPRIPGVRTETRTIEGGAGAAASGAAAPVMARRYSPASPADARPLPGWLLLHGAAVQGPDHPALMRFAAALAYSGSVVLIPEIPGWSRLDLNPEHADGVVARALQYLVGDTGVLPGGAVLAGFSFGCPQAIRIAADLAGDGRVRGVVGFGGYCDLSTAVRFGLTGEYEWQGRTRRAPPDPYGRWVLGGNYLKPPVSGALLKLAALAGARGVMAWEPYYDGAKEALARAMPPDSRRLFRLFAPPAGSEPEPGEAARAAASLARAALGAHPLLVLPGSFDGAALPSVHLLHGRGDPLVPFTETLALERRLLEAGVPRVSTTVTGLIAHARESGRMVAQPLEALRFLRAMRNLMSLQLRPVRS